MNDWQEIAKESMQTGGQEFTDQLIKAYKKVFSNDNVVPYFQALFNQKIERRALLYPFASYHLQESELTALCKAIIEIGEKEFNVTQIPTYFNHKEQRFRWTYSIIEAAGYFRRDAPYSYNPNAVFSSLGNWGLLITDSEFGFIGGPQSFVDNFLSLAEVSQDEMALHFLKDYFDNRDWAMHVLNYAIGEERATRMLEKISNK